MHPTTIIKSATGANYKTKFWVSLVYERPSHPKIHHTPTQPSLLPTDILLPDMAIHSFLAVLNHVNPNW